VPVIDWVRELASEDAAPLGTALLDVAEHLSESGSWACELATGKITCSKNLFRILDLSPADSRPDVAELLDHVHPDDRNRLERWLGSVNEREPPAEVRCRIITSRGTTRFLHAVVAARFNRPSGPVLIGWVRDTTEWCAAEREIAARSAVTEALSHWENLEEGATRLIAELAAALGFSRGALWVPTETGLVARASWDERDSAALKAALKKLRLDPGEGLAGQAWQTGELACFSSVAERTDYRFRGAALEEGLRGAIAVPIVWLGEVLAVIGLGGPDQLEMTDRLRISLVGVAREVGAFMAKRRGELRGSILSRRELEVLQLAADGLTGPEIASRLHVSPATVKTHFERIYGRYGVPDRVAAVAKAVREGLIN
jgi:DNA-binding CsgD family transcriptional regulator